MKHRASCVVIVIEDSTATHRERNGSVGLIGTIAVGYCLPSVKHPATWELCTHKLLEMIIMFLPLSFFFGLHPLPLAYTSNTLPLLLHCSLLQFQFGYLAGTHTSRHLGILQLDIR